MLLGSTVRAVVDFDSMPPRHAIRPSAPPITVVRPQPRGPEPSAASASSKPSSLQIKLQTILGGLLNTVRPFPDALNALREYFRGIQGLEIIE